MRPRVVSLSEFILQSHEGASERERERDRESCSPRKNVGAKSPIELIVTDEKIHEANKLQLQAREDTGP